MLGKNILELSILKKISLIKCTYNWKGLSCDVNSYLSVCLDCACSKPSRVKPLGLLIPLQQSDAPWKSIYVDFIVELGLRILIERR